LKKIAMASAKSKAGSTPQGFSAVHFILLLVVILVCVFPFYWMVSTSFKEQAAILSPAPQFFFQPTLGNYTRAFEKFDIGASLVNSLIVALSTTAISLVLGAPAAYAIARFDFKGKRDLWFWFISNRMISPIVVALPISSATSRKNSMRRLPWRDTILSRFFGASLCLWLRLASLFRPFLVLFFPGTNFFTRWSSLGATPRPPRLSPPAF
jgi:ABC-type glycerol-3-phosphate transport system permease component